MFYFCSLGSNIEPANNVAKALDALTRLTNDLTLSPLIQTEPHGMSSSHPFYNALFWFESEEDAESIKADFNAIETRLGRDRSDPSKKLKDRPIDLDILYAGPRKALASLSVEDPYLAPLTPILSGMAPSASVVTLKFAGKRLGLGVFRLLREGDTINIERVNIP